MRPTTLWRLILGIQALELHSICQKAGDIIESHRKDGMAVDTKSDGSPVTDADRESSEYIVKELRGLEERLPIISEENWDPENEDQSNKSDYWIIDPLDGTRDFIEGKDDFTVNLCWIKKNEIYMGCIYHPPSKTFYFAQRNGGAFMQVGSGDLNRINAKFWPDERPSILLSRSHATFEYELARKVWPKSEVIGMASALKFGKLAEGYADLYFREGPTMEWDTAAGQLIVEEAGGILIDWQCEKIEYGKKDRRNPGFIAIANRAFIGEVYDELKKSRITYGSSSPLL
jgi:3'(2'), 5'-bisphosphate nucleotidase